MSLVRWLVRRHTAARRRRKCFHGIPAPGLGTLGGRSFVGGHLVDLGRRKLFECQRSQGGCGRRWIT